MNVLIFDDTDTGIRLFGSRSIKERNVYCLPKKEYGRQSIDDFFLAASERKSWQSAPGGRGGTHTLGKLTENARVIFLVKVHLEISLGATAQDQEGVELLKHIRLTEDLGELRQAHVVLYSDSATPLELLRRRPNNTIILSKGVTVLPYADLSEKLHDPNYLTALVDDRAEIDDGYLSSFVRGDFRPIDAAHEFSNWWGLRQLAMAIGGELGDVRYPLSVRENLRRLENKKARLLYDANAIVGGQPSAEMKSPRFPAGKFRIICIDDEKGWGELLTQAFAVHAGRRISVIAPPLPSSHEIDEDWIQTEIVDRAPDLVMCDLRLYGASEGGKPIGEMSGIRVIQAIRNLDPGVPVILMTASNKAWTFEGAINSGVDAYWMKEGIGEHMPPGGAAENYVKLLDLVARALGPRYQFMRRFARFVTEVRCQTQPWWANHLWPNDDQVELTQADINSVLNHLSSVLAVLREYLRLFEMGYGYKGDNNAIQTTWLCSLIVEAAKVIEAIHKPRANTAVPRTLTEITSNRKDYWASYLSLLRNRAAHPREKADLIAFPLAQEVMSGVIAWLLENPASRTADHYNSSEIFQQAYGKPAATK